MMKKWMLCGGLLFLTQNVLAADCAKIEKLAENGITIYKDENEEAIKIALSKLRIQQEKMQELDANILYLKKQREVGEQLKNQSKGEDDNGR